MFRTMTKRTLHLAISLSFAASLSAQYVPPGGGSGGTPGGSNTQVQFNDSSAFGGNSGFTFDKSTGIATLGTFAAPAYFTVVTNADPSDDSPVARVLLGKAASPSAAEASLWIKSHAFFARSEHTNDVSGFDISPNGTCLGASGICSDITLYGKDLTTTATAGGLSLEAMSDGSGRIGLVNPGGGPTPTTLDLLVGRGNFTIGTVVARLNESNSSFDIVAGGPITTLVSSTITLGSLAGSGTRCVHASSTGVLSPTSGDCGSGGGGGDVNGGTNLNTVGSIPYVSSASTINQDASLSFDTTQKSILVGNTTQARIGTITASATTLPGIWFGASAASPTFTNYAFLLDSSGATLINTPTGKDLIFLRNNGALATFRVSSPTGLVLSSNYLWSGGPSPSTSNWAMYGDATVTAINAGTTVGLYVGNTAVFSSTSSLATATVTIKAAGYQSSDGTAGITGTTCVAATMQVKNGLVVAGCS